MAATITAPHARATARYQHVSPYKVRQVLDLVRGLAVDDAERTLLLCQKDAADDVLKVLESAISNAEHNFHLPVEELYVAVAFADEGPTRKWGQPRARGRYFRIRKRTSHITLIVARYEEDELERRRRLDETSGRGSAVAQRRRAERVRRSRRQQADDHDHDHDHDHDEELDAGTALIDAAAEADVAEADVAGDAAAEDDVAEDEVAEDEVAEDEVVEDSEEPK